jgi:hypothetical protein
VVINDTVWAAVRQGERGEFADVATVSGCLEWLRSYAKDCAAAYSLSNRWSAPVHVRLQAYAEREFWKKARG